VSSTFGSAYSGAYDLLYSDKDYEAMEKQVQADVEHALRFAEESPLPAPEKLYTDVYANPIEPGKS